MKKLIILFTLMATSCLVNAQQFHVEWGPSFEEPRDGWNKVLQLTNGNTFFFNFNPDDGIQIRVYDKTHKVASVKNLKSGIWDADKMDQSQIEGLYEIKGQPVIFLQQTIYRTPTLFRIVLDPATGAVVSQTKLGELMRYGAGAAYAMHFGHVDPNNSYVEKDPASDCYAVAYANGFAHETNARIEVVHYNGEHQEIGRAFYTSPGDQFKYLRFLGMTVDGDRNVFVCTYAFNKRGEKDSRIIVSRLHAGEKEFAHKLLDFSADFADTKGTMQYNPYTKLIQLFTITKMETRSKIFRGTTTGYLPVMTYIDPASLNIVDAKAIVGEKVSAYAQQKLEQDGYTGLPQNMIINQDRTTTIPLEEMTEIDVTQNGAIVSQKTQLDNMGILVLDDTGGERNGYVMLKAQMAEGAIPPMYLAEKGKGYWSYRKKRMMQFNNNEFMSFDFVNTDKANYVIYNDVQRNIDEERRKLVRIQGVNECQTIIYTLKPDGTLSRQYLFGDPKDEDKATMSYIEASHYMKDTKTYATLVVKREKKEKHAKLVWVTFE